MPPTAKNKLVLGLLISLATLLLCGGGAYLVWTSAAGKMWVKTTFRNPMGAGELDARSAINFFDLDRIGDQFLYDPVAFLVPSPNHTSEWEWPEHPTGRIVLRTNELGFREDGPVDAEKRGTRILVAGDSHTGGLVYNRESFANQLEARLSDTAGWQGVEVVNAGVPYTGPRCYLGILRKYLYLKPDIFIAALFTGNDFADDLRLRYVLDGWSLPRERGEYRDRLKAAAKAHPEGLFQGFNQAVRWKYFPQEKERSLEIVIESFENIQTICEKEGIRFVALVLPTKMDVDSDDVGARQEIRELLGMTPEDVAINRELGERFVAAMESAGIECIDPTLVMDAREDPMYWTKDYHLNLDGHALVAEELFQVLVGQQD